MLRSGSASAGALLVALGCPAEAPSLPAAGPGGTLSVSSDSGPATEATGSTGSTPDDTTMGTGAGMLSTGSTGPADSGSSASTGEATSTGPPPVDPYAACPTGDDDECGPGGKCVPLLAKGGVTATVCGSTPCATADECAAALTGTATPVCVNQFDVPTCALECGEGDCPDGMDCYDTNRGALCLWPL